MRKICLQNILSYENKKTCCHNFKNYIIGLHSKWLFQFCIQLLNILILYNLFDIIFPNNVFPKINNAIRIVTIFYLIWETDISYLIAVCTFYIFYIYLKSQCNDHLKILQCITCIYFLNISNINMFLGGYNTVCRNSILM